ncbi:MAG: hypothetical protein R2824_08025 [Saprospiraceae bacterium]|nr:hypothetical protein [Lewinella sp.]
MKNIVYLLSLLILSVSAFAQQPLTGTWVCPLDPNEGYESETLTFSPDGVYQCTIAYLNGEEYGIGPDIAVGYYQYDGTTLHLYDLVNDNHLTFPTDRVGNSQLILRNSTTQERFTYQYRGPGEVSAVQRGNLQAWEYYRRLGGVWQSKETILKVLPSLGIMLIRNPNDPNYFNWGQYSISGNVLSIREISAEQNTFYQGNIQSFGETDFRMENGGDVEHYRYQGKLQLNEQETFMVQQYMNTVHRTNMSIIDAMDGVQDFIWRRVDEHGNIRY